MKTALTSLTILLITLRPCNEPSGPRAEDTNQPITTPGDTIRLHIHDSMILSKNGSTLTFLDVPSDSRCPKDVACPTAGQALAEFAIVRPSGDSIRLTLANAGAIDILQDDFVDTLGYRISLRSLDPYPVSTDSLWDKSRYSALLSIGR